MLLQYQTHKSHNMNFMFNDIMGLESDDGVLEEDVILAMEGHVNEGYEVKWQLKDLLICKINNVTMQ